jgi:hypothetical protein
MADKKKGKNKPKKGVGAMKEIEEKRKFMKRSGAHEMMKKLRKKGKRKKK